MSFLLSAEMTALDKFLEILKVIVLGIVEGITEWLPVSSTGHMILLRQPLNLQVSEGFWDLFLIVIQLGAIVAVPCLFWDKLVPFSRGKSEEDKKNTYKLWSKVIVGVIPTGIVGFAVELLLPDTPEGIEAIIVSIALVVYGVAFILVERLKKGSDYRVESVYDLSFRDALVIGAFQCLSLIPGTSRSGSTILGGMLTGVSRPAASEFSFFMAIPVMLGASGLKTVKFFIDGGVLNSLEVWLLVIGIAVSFLVSLVAIKFLMSFVKRHSFAPFGVYRIVLGVIVLGYYVITLIA